MRYALSLFFLSNSFFFCCVLRHVLKKTDKKWSGVVSILLLTENRMMMMLWMYVAAIIELKDYILIRTKCVNIVNRCNRVLTETKRSFNRIGLINDYMKMLNIPIYSQAVFLFHVVFRNY